MQSGIKASADLKTAFQDFQTSTSLALLVTITSESLVPSTTISAPSTSFPASLSALEPHLTPTQATYIILRTPSGLLCTTYVPDSAPVRQKMLFASTRLTLVRELGTEHFPNPAGLFVTDKKELTEDGWRRHEAHEKLEQPLTEEERASKELREAEGAEVGGTSRREGHYVGSEGGVTGGRSSMGFGVGVKQALEELKDGGAGGLVQLHLDVAAETIQLAGKENGVSPGQLASHIPAQEPRYTFYTFAPSGADVKTVFIYTCPPSSKVKDRMVYASSRRVVVNLAEEQASLTLDKKLEGAGPEDFPEDVLLGEFAEKKEESKSFTRPKRPGRR